MKQGVDTASSLKCSEVRQRLKTRGDLAPAELHFQNCPRCARERRVVELQRAVLALAASREPITPDETFFISLRAKIAREASASARSVRGGDDSWPSLVWSSARQLIPIMAALLLLVLGATFLWRTPVMGREEASLRPSDRVLFNDVYEYPQPTDGDVLETLVAIEDKNGK
jgi:hypothetical protein